MAVFVSGLESVKGEEEEEERGGVCFGSWSSKSSMGLSVVDRSISVVTRRPALSTAMGAPLARNDGERLANGVVVVVS